MALTRKDKAELAELIGGIVDDRVEKALGTQGRERKIIRPDDPPLPTADDLLGHALAPIFSVGVIRFTVETYYDANVGQVIRYGAVRVDGAEMKPMVVSPLQSFGDVLDVIAVEAKALPKNGLRWDPSDPSTKPLTEGDKDQIRKKYRGEIDRRFQGRMQS